MFRALLFLVFIALPLGAAALFWLALAERPAIEKGIELAHQDIARARQILQENDPRRLTAGSRRRVTIDEQDLSLAVHYLARTLAEVNARVRLEDGRAVVTASRRLPLIPRRPYLNLTVELRQDGDLIEAERIRLGRLEIPHRVANPLLRYAIELAASDRQVELLHAAVQKVELQPGKVSLSYVWNPALLGELTALGSPQQKAALQVYHGELLRLSRERPRRLTSVLARLFELAGQRSQDSDPVAENRALLTVLAAWAVGQRLPLPGQQTPQRPERFSARLRGRVDLSQHYLVSAALAAAGDGLLAKAVGLHKEVADSSSRSGFSFSDIAADLAGTRLGELATASRASAREIQVWLGRALSEAEIMPAVEDLPDNLSDTEFHRRFGEIGSAAYLEQVSEIEDRVQRIPLYGPRQ